jgi:type III restriction enzyme
MSYDGMTKKNKQAENNEQQIGYTYLKLKSYYQSRQREKYRLSPKFSKYFKKSAKNYGLKDKIDLKATAVENLIISDVKRENVDEMVNTKITANIQLDEIGERQLQQHYDSFLLDTLGDISSSADNNSRAVGIIKRAIEDFFLINFMMNYKGDDSATIMRLVLNEKNNKHFDNVIDEAIANYLNDLEKQSGKIEMVENWEVPQSNSYTSKSVTLPVKKSILVPFYYDKEWKTEMAFIDYLEKNNKVDWWYKNGERDNIYFAVPYTENDRQRLFYVDFVVRFTDGKIGLFDTKSGQTITTGKNKSDGLQAYLKEQSGKNLIGGIVAQSNNRWVIYLGEGKDLVADNFANWETLDKTI